MSRKREFTGPVKVLVPCGSLGAGVREDEVAWGIAQGAHVIASDAGSTDSGAAYLALGKSKNSRQAVRRDLTILLQAHKEHGLPVIIGTSGQAGGDLNLAWTHEILREVCTALGIAPRVALIHCEQDKATVKRLNAAGRIRPLPPLGPLDDAAVDACEHIVAALGVEPFLAALDGGAEVILAGRATDTAVLACYPIWKGAGWGAAWHAGKTGECGGQCAQDSTASAGCLLTVGQEGFRVEPLTPATVCTPYSVSKHMLYENADPVRLTEPGGILDVSQSAYTQVDGRTVEVTGSQWLPQPYTMKLEGAGGGGYQTIMLVGIQDPDVLEDVDGFHDRFLAALYARARSTAPAEELGDFHISLRMYGWNAVSGDRPAPGTPAPRELGVLFVATARTQEIANAIAHACNPWFFHYPAVLGKEMPSYGFAFSPADVPRGRVWEFKLNHVVAMDDPMELVRIEWHGGTQAAVAPAAQEAVHG